MTVARIGKKKFHAQEGPPVKEIILGIIVAIEAACAMLLALVIPLRRIIDMFEVAEKRHASKK